MEQSIQEYSKKKFWNIAFKNFKGCLPQILLGPYDGKIIMKW